MSKPRGLVPARTVWSRSFILHTNGEIYWRVTEQASDVTVIPIPTPNEIAAIRASLQKHAYAAEVFVDFGPD